MTVPVHSPLIPGLLPVNYKAEELSIQRSQSLWEKEREAPVGKCGLPSQGVGDPQACFGRLKKRLGAETEGT